MFFKFCKSIGLDEEYSESYDLVMERNVDAYRMEAEDCAHEDNQG